MREAWPKVEVGVKEVACHIYISTYTYLSINRMNVLTHGIAGGNIKPSNTICNMAHHFIRIQLYPAFPL